jgi:hypothetical protein
MDRRGRIIEGTSEPVRAAKLNGEMRCSRTPLPEAHFQTRRSRARKLPWNTASMSAFE